MNAAGTFHCPCGQCSLETYLSEGCPHGKLPYLHLSNLDEDDRENLIQKLDNDTNEIIQCFSDLVGDICASLKEHGVTTEELALRVLQLQASPTIDKPLMSEEKDQLKTSRSIVESFIILEPYMSFFNFQLLEHIIKGRQTGSDEDREKMDAYRKKFELYCRHRIFEVAPEAVGKSTIDLKGRRRVAFAIVTSKDDPLPDSDLGHVVKVRNRIATILGLDPSTLFLHRIDISSLILTFSVPNFVAKELFPIKPSLVSALKKDGYTLFAASHPEGSNKDMQAIGKRSEMILHITCCNIAVHSMFN